MRIHVTSVHVDDQSRALEFYTDVLGFVKKTDLPAGEARWLTVVSPDDPDGTELLLEPANYPGLAELRQSMMSDGIPATSFAVVDVDGRGRPARGPRRHLHPAAGPEWTCHDGCLRRHLRQPHPDRRAGVMTVPALTAVSTARGRLCRRTSCRRS